MNSAAPTRTTPEIRTVRWARMCRGAMMLGISCAAVEARAQEATPASAAAPAAGPAEAAPTPAATPTPAVATPVDAALTARLDEIEQEARIATRKIELLEEDLAKKRAESSEAVADVKGFVIRSPGKTPDFVLKLKGLVQWDVRKFFEPEQVDNLNFLMRRVRPTLDGTVLGLIDFRLMPDFGNGQAVLFDAYIDVHPAPWARLRVGKFKSPLGLERLQSDPDLPFIERSLTQDLTPVRDIGVQLWGDVGFFQYAAGVFDGAADSANLDTDNSKDKDWVGRIFVTPFRSDGLRFLGDLGIGVAGSTGKRRGSVTTTNLTPYRTTGQQTFFQYLAAGANTVFATGRQNRLNPQLSYYNGSFGLLTDLVWSWHRVQKGAEIERLLHSSWHVGASYVFGGRDGYEGAVPDAKWSPADGHIGALQLAARYQVLTIDDDAFPTYADPNASARHAQGVGVTATWVLSRLARLAVSYDHTKFDGGAALGADRKTEKALIGRAQVNF